MGKIYLYTSLFPFGNVAEAFVKNELNYIGEKELVIIPINKANHVRQIPPNVKIDNNIYDRSCIQIIHAVFGIFTPRVIKEVIRSIKTLTKLSYIKDLLKYLYAANLVYYDILRRVDKDSNDVFYSYWLSYAPIAFAYYKSSHLDTRCKFVSRAHGSDLYSTLVGVYYPLRNFTFKYIDKVYTISINGKKFLNKEYCELEGKTELSRLGVDDNMKSTGNNHSDSSSINVVSCSSIIPLKRVHLIYKSLYSFAKNHPCIHIKWSHFGDGYLKQDLQSLIMSVEKLDNLDIELKGSMHNEDILKDYQNNLYHCLINLSESEGVPVSMMEAISSGIPLLGTKVGGTNEIITDETGRLLDVNFTQSEFDEAFEFIINNIGNLSVSAHHFFLENYNSKINYTAFYSSFDRI